MNCIITKLPTKNKWRGHAIHPYALAKAKIMAKQSENQFNKYGQKMDSYTLRSCLMSLQAQFQDTLAKEKEVSNERYAELLKEFLGG